MVGKMYRIILPVLLILFGVVFAQLSGENGFSQRVADAEPVVPTIAIDDVLTMIAQGKKVLFIDAREPEEWEEEHLPGAINMPLRDIRKLDDDALGKPDLIIAYCLKDFRGFEAAKALQNASVDQASILKEFGFNSWKQRGLPTTRGMQPEDVALAKLQQCASGELACKE